MDASQIAVQEVLQKKFHELRQKNPSYSLRAFAKKTELSSGALSQILNGKRRVSFKIAQRLATRLAIDPQERAHLLNHFPQRHAPKSPRQKIASHQYLQLSADQFKVIGEWYHFAILSLINTKNFSEDTDFIARRLGVTSRNVKDGLDRLLRLGLITKNKNGKLKRSAVKFQTTDEISSPALRRSHSANLELAQKALDHIPIQQRDFTAITMAIDPKKIPKVKEKIRAFQDDISQLLESGSRTEVYKFCIQLFPLTQITGESP